MCSPLTEWQRVWSMMCSCLGSRGPGTLPSTVEARSWATSMNHLLQSSYGTALFRAFLQREYAEENLDFILQVERYWEATPKKRGKEAWRIYRTYICIGSPHELNLDMLSRKVRSAAARANPEILCFAGYGPGHDHPPRQHLRHGPEAGCQPPFE